MAVTIQYLVVRNGIEKMSFTNKKEADAYDRLLDLGAAIGRDRPWRFPVATGYRAVARQG
ncbi:hypothetical protein C7I36_02060 [Zobellella taiwanensis]|uniref:Uncharacterized protein n=1 Tax=Zobellella taiwanensis TaxID=347535 RepID=A0A2P7RAC7_9GAMM|nr:hypothetical protein C7I36_02060 [Zobellella taiwanensis]